MKTLIFKDYSKFVKREDKKINGVTQLFADENPTWSDEKNNFGCWNCSRCSDCLDCSGCSRCSDCSDCSDCSRCSDCSGCSGCSRCSGCSGCSGLSNEENFSAIKQDNSWFKVPVIEKIHQKVLDAINDNGNKLNMEAWHSCETTHCRGGWVEVLAGKEGKSLAEKTSTLFAAMQIYKASSPIKVSPKRFFEDNKTAMADIVRCAEEERKLNK